MDFIQTAKQSIPSFLERLYRGEGFFSYTLDSDLYSPQQNWGLANTVFATKIYFILRYSDSLDQQRKSEMTNFIRRFQKTEGVFFDSLVHKKTCFRNKLAAIKNLNFSNFFGQKTVMAESRQATVALILLGQKPDRPFLNLPYTQRSIVNFFKNLNWRNIWGASSHIGHLMFFYRINAKLFNFKKEASEELIKCCLDKIDALQNKDDGMWYKVNVSPKQKINAAMKIISAFNIIDKKDIPNTEKIIDFVLGFKENYYYDACDNLNAMFVLKYAFDSLERNYRNKDVRLYCERSIDRFKRYFFNESEYGGFSFLPNDGPRRYYGMKVTGRFSGPDIHGTMLFTWAVSLAAAILNINKESFQEIIN